MTAAISNAATDALRGAAQRLLASTQAEDGHHLTVTALAAEAGVSRATAYRATDIVSAFRAQVRHRTAVSKPDRAEHSSEVGELRETVHVMAQRIQVLTLLTIDQERTIAALHDELARLGGAAVVPLGRGPGA
jgi:DNA-binding MurR/RpiR family transcriptional regulator